MITIRTLWVQENQTFTLSWFEQHGVNEDALVWLAQASSPLVTMVRTGHRLVVTINFVGATAVDGVAIYSLPKFVRDPQVFSEAEKLKVLRVVLQAISKARNGVLALSSVDVAGSEFSSETHWLQIAQLLVNDFIQHGKYFARDEFMQDDGTGEIDWNETIARPPSLILGGRPVYISVVTFEQRFHTNSDIAQLHLAVLAEIGKRVRELDPLGVLGFIAPSIQPNLSLASLGDRESLLRIINAERVRQFEDRKLRLLELLKNYIIKFYDPLSVRDDTFAGTTHFEIIWEKMCAAYFRDVFHPNVFNLSAPLWIFEPDGSSEKVAIRAARSLVPDTVSLVNGDLYIFDAKYYLPAFNEASVRSQPGATDVAKQFMYVPAVEELWEGKRVKGNAFIIPSLIGASDPLHARGHVTYTFLDREIYKPIFIVEIDPLHLVDCFVSGECISEAEVVRIFAVSQAD